MGYLWSARPAPGARRPAADRHLVLLLGTVCVIALPAIATVAPPLLVDRPAIPGYSQLQQSIAVGDQPLPPATYGAGQAPSTYADPQPQALEKIQSRWSPASLVAVIYLFVSGVLAGYVILRSLQSYLSARARKPYTDQDTRALLEDVRRNMAIRQAVALATSPTNSSPWVVGVFRPVVVLPPDFRSWSRQHQQHALIHEIAHVRRLDNLSDLLAHLVCAAYWINPLAWLIARRIRAEAERACDDEVLLRGASDTDYAEQLVSLARGSASCAASSPAATAMATRSSLPSRIRRILNADLRRISMNRSKVIACGLIASVLLIPVAMLQLQTVAAQPGNPGLLGYEDQMILQRGPANSEELKQLAEAMSAIGMFDELSMVFGAIPYLTGSTSGYGKGVQLL